MKTPHIEHSKVFTILRIGDYLPDGVNIKSILKKTTGNVNAVFIDRGAQLSEKQSRFDHLIQVIEGNAEILIDDVSFHLASGQSIIIPAHSKNIIRANEAFKMISTIIKSGYE